MSTAKSPTADVTIIEDSSINIDNVNALQNEQNTDATPDSSSAKVEGAKPKSTLELVKEALKPEEPKQTVDATKSPTEATGSNQPEGNDYQEPNPAVQDEEDKKLPFHNHPRFKQLVQERNALLDQVKEVATLEQEVEAFKDGASRFEVINNFVQQNGLQSEEIDTGFQVMAAIKAASAYGGDPKQALDILIPIVQQLQTIAGDVIPDDLQAKIDSGHLDVETATDIARIRADINRTKQRENVVNQKLQQNQQHEQSQRQQYAQEATANQIRSTVTAWEDTWKKSDPDYALKQPLVEAKVALLASKHGYPQTPEHALILATKAREAVENDLKAIKPKGEVKTVTGGGGRGNPQQKINGIKDAVNAALRGEYKMSSPSTFG